MEYILAVRMNESKLHVSTWTISKQYWAKKQLQKDMYSLVAFI